MSIITFLMIIMSINSNYYLYMEVNQVADCLKSIKIENEELYHQEECEDNYTYPLFPKTIYNMEQNISFDFYSGSQDGYFEITIYINEYKIGVEHNEFWTCENCNDECSYYYNETNTRFEFQRNESCEEYNYTFSFRVNSISDIDSFSVVGEYYYLSSQEGFYITICNLEDEINLINFDNTIIFGNADNNTLSTPYKEKGFKIKFDNSISFSGKFIGLNSSKNDTELDNDSIFQVSENKGLRYKLSNEEKAKYGVHLRINLTAYSNYSSSSSQVSNEEEFDFYICLNGYHFYYNDNIFKCLNDGFFYDSENNKFLSCYETCFSYNFNKEIYNADILQSYCDNSDESHIYQIKEKTDINKKIDSLNCGKCQNQYITNDNKCVESCNFDDYPYLLYNRKSCYNYISNSYYTFISNYSNTYSSIENIPIININTYCPANYTFYGICVKSLEDIFYLINPKKLIGFNTYAILFLHE